MIAAFRSNGGEGKRLVLQVHLSWAASEEALRVAHDQWRTNVFPPPPAGTSRWSTSSTASPRT